MAFRSSLLHMAVRPSLFEKWRSGHQRKLSFAYGVQVIAICMWCSDHRCSLMALGLHVSLFAHVVQVFSVYIWLSSHRYLQMAIIDVHQGVQVISSCICRSDHRCLIMSFRTSLFVYDD